MIGEGISVNVRLIFTVERHRAVMDAYLAGLEAAFNEAPVITGVIADRRTVASIANLES